MTHTERHVLFALAWFFGFPVIVLAGVTTGTIPFSQFHSTLASVAFGLGLVSVFASWSFRDAPSHDKPTYVAALFTAAWFLVFALAVFPYLFATRGAKRGAIASIRFLALCIGCLLGWIAILPSLARAQDAISMLLGAS